MVESHEEQERLKALERLHIIDTSSEPPFDRIVRLVARMFDVPNAAIHLLDHERQWVKAFEGTRFECPRDQSSCQFTIEQNHVVVVPDMCRDPRFRDLPGVGGANGVHFYAGAPLRSSCGHNLGALCILDTKPRDPLTADQKQILEELAGVVIETMELRVNYLQAREALDESTELDPVTGLRNRAGTLRICKRLLADRPEGSRQCFLKVRLDRMELVHGATGDVGCNEILREASARLQGLLLGGELLGRGSGNGFIIAWQTTADRSGSLSPETVNRVGQWGDRLLEALRQPFVTQGETVQLTASIGVAYGEADEEDLHFLLDTADSAAMAQQGAGGNGIQWANSEQRGRFRRRLSLESRLRTAVSQGTFEVFYQPIVDLSDGMTVRGAESLIRWGAAGGKPVGPDVFIPMAEELGLIERLGHWVFRRVCEEHMARRGENWPSWLSINVSPYQLHDADFAQHIAAIAEETGVSPGDIHLEITESAIEHDFDEIAGVLRRLRLLGFGLALDDFGVGHSSLARVIQLPFTKLKVDRGFVADCPTGPGAAVVSSIAHLSGSLGLDTIAEGVESQEHEQYLQALNVRYAQGYRYARPMPAPDLGSFLSKRAVIGA